MTDFAETFDAFTPATDPEAVVKPAYAMIEIFGHRQHYAEIRDVEIAGGKLLEVRDVDTQKVHMYGAGAIFSLTTMSEPEIAAHVADVKRLKDENNKWRRENEARRTARLTAPDAETDDEREMPF